MVAVSVPPASSRSSVELSKVFAPVIVWAVSSVTYPVVEFSRLDMRSRIWRRTSGFWASPAGGIMTGIAMTRPSLSGLPPYRRA